MWRAAPPRDAAFLRGETVGALVDRVGRAMERLHADGGWDMPLLVAHGGTNRAILSATLGGPGAFFGHLEQSPACINIVDTGTYFVVRAVNLTPYDPVHAGPRNDDARADARPVPRLPPPDTAAIAAAEAPGQGAAHDLRQPHVLATRSASAPGKVTALTALAAHPHPALLNGSSRRVAPDRLMASR